MIRRPEPGEIQVEVHSRPDRQGKVIFAAYWLDDYLPPNGVRGQMFSGTLDDFKKRVEINNRTRTTQMRVTVLPPKVEPPTCANR